MARAVSAAALVSAAACSDGAGVTAPSAPAPAPNVTAIPCTASVRSGRLECGASAAVNAAGARGDRIIGGQRMNVVLTSTHVAYDSATQRFSADVTVQNLLVQRMGSDGATVSGVKVFFSSGPSVTGGSGDVTVQNPDGTDLFTASAQPYFDYPGALPHGAVSAPKHWVFDVPRTVDTFAFTVYVSTPVVPVIVFEMTVSGNRDIYRMGIDGNDLVKLSTSTALDASPTVANGMVVFHSYRDGNAELYSVPLNGGAETRLTTSPTLAETSPALSPDGTRLAWVSSRSGGSPKIWIGTSTATGGAAAVPGSTDATLEDAPKWKDDTTLAYVSTGGSGSSSADLFRLVPGSEPALLTGVASASDLEPAWSPNGTKVAFTSNRSGDTELYLLDVASGAVSRLTNRSGTDAAPTWLKDGRIVYTCVTGSVFKLCMLDPASPATVTPIPTPYTSLHPAAVPY